MVMNLKDVFNGMFVDKNGRTVGQQLDLLTIGLARRTDPDTSKMAAKSVKPSLEDVVLQAIRSFPNGCIADEVVDHTGLRWGSVTARFKPLINKGLIEDTGERRRGASGRSQRVLKAV
jgi:hypothetical protein